MRVRFHHVPAAKALSAGIGAGHIRATVQLVSEANCTPSSKGWGVSQHLLEPSSVIAMACTSHQEMGKREGEAVNLYQHLRKELLLSTATVSRRNDPPALGDSLQDSNPLGLPATMQQDCP